MLTTNSDSASARTGGVRPPDLRAIDQIAARASALRLRLWTEEEFLRGEDAWSELLSRSNADPLFMSWGWHASWWASHRAKLQSRLELYAAYAPDGRLVGLAPFHRRKVTHRPLPSGVRLELMGSAVRAREAALSERLDFIVEPHHADAFCAALAEELASREWVDLVIGSTERGSLAARFISEYVDDVAYVRTTNALVSYRTQLPAEFAGYAQALPPGVRRKVWNHRRRLQQPTLGIARDEDELKRMLGDLEQYHRRRWGRAFMTGPCGAFHRAFARHSLSKGTLRLSRLTSGGRTISVMYNVRIGATEYNLHSAFDGENVASISPGYLHFGYALEGACRDRLAAFDFLAGEGRERNYKPDFGVTPTPLITLQAIRARTLAWLYREYDRRLDSVPGERTR